MDRRDFLHATTVVAAATTYGVSRTSALGETSISGFSAPPSLGINDHVTPATAEQLRSVLERVSPLSVVRDLAGNVSTPGTPPPGAPEILKPIDVGAKDLLASLTQEQLKYSPYELEYLLETLNDHINNCLNLREKGQQLEVLASSARLDLLLEQKTIQFLSLISDFDKANAPHIAGSMFEPTVSGASKLTGSTSADAATSYETRHNIEKTLLGARLDIAAVRLALLKQPGGGNNHTERFGFLKSVFEQELQEAYRRARSILVGCREVYALQSDVIEDVPEPTDIGYLNKLAFWTKKASYALERAALGKTTNIIAIPLRKGLDANSFPGLLSDADYTSGRTSGSFTFKITADTFATGAINIKNPRIRGLEAYAWTDAQPKALDYVRVRLALPDQSIGPTTPKLWSHKPVVSLPIVTLPTGPEFIFQSRREVYNTSPLGDWIMQIDKRSITDHDTNKDEILKNIFIVMRLSSDVTA